MAGTCPIVSLEDQLHCLGFSLLKVKLLTCVGHAHVVGNVFGGRFRIACQRFSQDPFRVRFPTFPFSPSIDPGVCFEADPAWRSFVLNFQMKFIRYQQVPDEFLLKDFGAGHRGRWRLRDWRQSILFPAGHDVDKDQEDHQHQHDESAATFTGTRM